MALRATSKRRRSRICRAIPVTTGTPGADRIATVRDPDPAGAPVEGISDRVTVVEVRAISAAAPAAVTAAAVADTAVAVAAAEVTNP